MKSSCCWHVPLPVLAQQAVTGQGQGQWPPAAPHGVPGPPRPTLQPGRWHRQPRHEEKVQATACSEAPLIKETRDPSGQGGWPSPSIPALCRRQRSPARRGCRRPARDSPLCQAQRLAPLPGVGTAAPTCTDGFFSAFPREREPLFFREFCREKRGTLPMAAAWHAGVHTHRATRPPPGLGTLQAGQCRWPHGS